MGESELEEDEDKLMDAEAEEGLFEKLQGLIVGGHKDEAERTKMSPKDHKEEAERVFKFLDTNGVRTPLATAKRQSQCGATVTG